MKRKHLSLEERSIIERLVQEGKSNKAIAEVLGRSKSTIGLELERNCWRLGCRAYRSEVAESIAKKRRKHERKSRIAVKKLTQDLENAWALHPPASRFFFELNKLHFKVECALSNTFL